MTQSNRKRKLVFIGCETEDDGEVADTDAFHEAIDDGDLELCKQWLSIRPSLIDNVPEFTPLYLASYRGHTNICALLIEHGVDVNHTENGGNTPLHTASLHTHADICKLLLENNADPTVLNWDDAVPLGYWSMDSPRDHACAGGVWNVFMDAMVDRVLALASICEHSFKMLNLDLLEMVVSYVIDEITNKSGRKFDFSEMEEEEEESDDTLNQ